MFSFSYRYVLRALILGKFCLQSVLRADATEGKDEALLAFLAKVRGYIFVISCVEVRCSIDTQCAYPVRWTEITGGAFVEISVIIDYQRIRIISIAEIT